MYIDGRGPRLSSVSEICCARKTRARETRSKADPVTQRPQRAAPRNIRPALSGPGRETIRGSARG